jgi:hypothetical protein
MLGARFAPSFFCARFARPSNPPPSHQTKSKERTIDFFQKLTSTTVATDAEKGTTECMMTNPETTKSLSFSLRKKSSGDYVFKPTANAKFLPKELQAKVEFGEDQLPFMMKEIYNTDVFKQDE